MVSSSLSKAGPHLQKGFFANPLVWPFSSVYPQMFCKTTVLYERFSALIIFIGLSSLYTQKMIMKAIKINF